jgi:uncharacterized membrane protein YeaQ/YmgE (transglycosylase-associated protein family)
MRAVSRSLNQETVMPTQDFRNGSDNAVVGRATWNFGYEEIYITFRGRTFQLHNVNELRTDGVRIGISVSDELFVYLSSTRDGERFQLSLNGEQLRADEVDFATSPTASTMSTTKITAQLAQPGKGKWKMQERVEMARRWCRALSSAFGGIVLFFALKSDYLSKQARREVLIAFGGAAIVLLLVDMLSKWDLGARFMMLLPPAVFGFCAFRTFTTYMDINNNTFELLSLRTGALAAIIVLFVAASLKCLVAQGSATRLHSEARQHKKLHPKVI